jgi:UDPglucose--hexose-1-phosphate uridylyltransferase
MVTEGTNLCHKRRDEPPSRTLVTTLARTLVDNMSDLRRDPVTGRWVVIAPERTRRPQDFRPIPVGAIGGDLCPFCEGQEAIAGRELLAWRDPGSAPDGPGWQVRVVANREPALRVESTLGDAADPLFQSLGGLGAHEVVIESPDHRASFATMTGEGVWRVLWAWRERMRDLRRDTRLRSFVIVKNVGAAAGALLDHSHSQLLALPLVPQHLRDELEGANEYHTRHARCVFCDLIAEELTRGRRVIAEDAGAVALAPFASRLPFETWIVPRDHNAAFDDASEATLKAVAERLQDMARRLHVALTSPPYTLLLHSAPVGEGSAAYHWHLELLPRLTPVSGLAWDGVYVNAVPPEEAAEVLRQAQGGVSNRGRR